MNIIHENFGEYGYLMTECEPVVRTIRFAKGYPQYYRISFPYHTFILLYVKIKGTETYYTSLHVYFHNNPDRKKWALPYLPNCNTDGTTCVTDDERFYSLPEVTDQTLKNAIDMFWSSNFNDAWSIALYEYDFRWKLSRSRIGWKPWSMLHALAELTTIKPNFWKELELFTSKDTGEHVEDFDSFKCYFEEWVQERRQ